MSYDGGGRECERVAEDAILFMSFSLCVTLISYTKVRDKSLPGTNTHTHTHKKKMQVYKKNAKGC